ncbi:MAG: hypothetical protein IPM39_09355 [Chloroflexi bacterium]|nr:hypothetical protein [Chloroflexota bacterium]
MNDLHTIDLTLRIVCEPDDAVRVALSGTELYAVCRAVSETLGLNGHFDKLSAGCFHVAPHSVTWVTGGGADEGEGTADLG